MLQRFLELREVVAGTVNFIKSAPPLPFAGDIEFLQEFCTLLKSVEFVTTEATGERFYTSSTLISITKVMDSKINTVSSFSGLREKLNENVFVQYKKRFGNFENSHFLAMTSLLDPRCKNLHLKDEALLDSWVKKLNNEIREKGKSSDSDSGQLSPVSSPSQGK
ncbi:hypothetical protein NPIL_535861 [Nephila pilipes]|uniref:Uncharacterized protein n=1 Tax=Nephila pilipes TaxID=299642 RepID=A0A8X6TUL7_NEPPI|nr:hypothetical protein NPIL_535861 [Nephila pilipes]